VNSNNGGALEWTLRTGNPAKGGRHGCLQRMDLDQCINEDKGGAGSLAPRHEWRVCHWDCQGDCEVSNSDGGITHGYKHRVDHRTSYEQSSRMKDSRQGIIARNWVHIKSPRHAE
jgi:hypothetical protein